MTDIGPIAERHGFNEDAAAHLLKALARGGGRMAQFNHPALGGMGQWHAGGMTMVGDMSNNDLKSRVAALCDDLVPHIGEVKFDDTDRSSKDRWRNEFGASSSSGSQNNMHYAVYPEARRLVIDADGNEQVYDTGDFTLQGVSQQQGDGRDLTFSTSNGPIRLSELKQVTARAGKPSEPEEVTAESEALSLGETPAERKAISKADHDEIAMIERLFELHKKGVLSDEEFAAKKSDLLSRL